MTAARMRALRRGLVATAALAVSWVLASGTASSEAAPGDRVTVAFVGDVLLHDSLLVQAARQPGPAGFHALWAQEVADALASADLAYANLEGPVAENVRCDGLLSARPPVVSFATGTCGPGSGASVYTGYPRFNYPPALLQALAEAGVDVVSTANNHALDRGPLGIDRTIDALERAGIAHTGTRRSGEATHRPALTPAGRFVIGWLACSSIPGAMADPEAQVERCVESSGAPAEALLASVRAMAADGRVDAVVVAPHWGTEYVSDPSAAQEHWAAAMVLAGATAVIGSHPHVLGPMASVTGAPSGTAGGDPDGAFVAYSMGNFVGDQTDWRTRASAVLLLDFARGATGRAIVAGWRYLPLFMQGPRDGASQRHTLVPMDRARPGAAVHAARAVFDAVLDRGKEVDLGTVARPTRKPPGRRLATADVRALPFPD